MADLKASVGDVLGGDTAPGVVSWNGKEYKCGAPTQGAKDRLEKMVAAAAIASVRDLKDTLPSDDYAAMWASTTAAIQSREHATGGALWGRVLSQPDGAALFPLSLFQEYQPAMTAAEMRLMMAEEPEQVGAVMALMVPRFFEKWGPGMGLSPEGVAELIRRATPTLSGMTPLKS